MNIKLYMAVKTIFNYLPEYREIDFFGMKYDVEQLMLDRIDQKLSLVEQAKLIKEIKDL